MTFVAPFFRRTFLAAALAGLVAASAFANTAIQPVPRDANWVKRHDGFVAIAKQGGIDVVFIGDSITDGWRREAPKGGKAVWDLHFAPLKAANFGIGGDRTQHVLWRLQNGELDGYQAKAAVVMIGTNNTGFEPDKTTPRNTPAETAAGVAEIIRTLRTKQPQAKILLLAIFPRGEKTDHPQRVQVGEINAAIAKLADGKTVHFLDINAKFLAPDGTLPKEIMPDFLHPIDQGYELWAAAIKEPLAKLLR